MKGTLLNVLNAYNNETIRYRTINKPIIHLNAYHPSIPYSYLQFVIFCTKAFLHKKKEKLKKKLHFMLSLVRFRYIFIIHHFRSNYLHSYMCEMKWSLKTSD